MEIQVMDGGMLTSLQDLGRSGYQKFGVLVNGAMDTFSLRLANLLVDNAAGEAAFEITLRGPELALEAGTVFALTGADLAPQVDGQPVPMFRPVYVKQDCRLLFRGCRRGCRAYMAVAGGFDVPLVMGSKSTYMRAGIGGYEGRALMTGDVLSLGVSGEAVMAFRQRMGKQPQSGKITSVGWFARGDFVFDDAPLRVTEGLQYDWFTKESRERFFQENFLITMQSDRMGYRLQGPRLDLSQAREMVSEPVAFGSVQVADGKPILLLADRQTTGGYPKIAQTAFVDLPRIGQRLVGQHLRFSLITRCAAERLYLRQEKYVEELAAAIHLKLREG